VDSLIEHGKGLQNLVEKDVPNLSQSSVGPNLGSDCLFEHSSHDVERLALTPAVDACRLVAERRDGTAAAAVGADEIVAEQETELTEVD
jgi:hypothetical protein